MTHHLLKGNETLEEWWKKNGLNHDKAREQRREVYIKQLKETAAIMDRYKNENATTD